MGCNRQTEPPTIRIPDADGQKLWRCLAYKVCCRKEHIDQAATAEQLGNLILQTKTISQSPSLSLNKFPADFYLLGNDAELALAQGDKPRMQQRLNALQALYHAKEGVYSDKYPANMGFLQYLSDFEQPPEAVLKLIEQTDKTVNFGWDFSDIQAVLKQLSQKRQQTAALFIDFFQRHIDLDTLKAKLNSKQP